MYVKVSSASLRLWTVSILLSLTAFARAADFALNAPSNSQSVFLAAPAQVEAATAYSVTTAVPVGAVLQTVAGRQTYIMLMHSGVTNLTITPTNASLAVGWVPVADSNSNLWRRITKVRQPRYVMNLGTSIVYVATGRTRAADGVGIPLAPGSAPNYFGGAITFALGEGQTGLSVWSAPGGRFGYGED